MFHQYYPGSKSGESVFTVDPRPIKFGPGSADETAHDAAQMGLQRVVVFTDPKVLNLELTRQVIHSLRRRGIEVELYAECLVEPTDASFLQATDFLRRHPGDGVISIGGGSVIDTAKAANLYARYPAELLTYVNKPIGAGQPVPGPLAPHIALPTTAGTGSESTGVAVFDLLSQQVKTGIASKYLKPDLAIIDPRFTYSVPPLVTAATAFDVLTHAIESYTAQRFSDRDKADDPALRPPYQGANPHSDIGSLEAIRLGGRYLLRAVRDPRDEEARIAMSWAATLAGIAFGNAGVHVPHAMSYSVAGLIRDYHPPGWPEEHSLCPHGISVVVNAPAAFAFTAQACADRHLEAAGALGIDTRDADANDGGTLLVEKMSELMRLSGIPNGLEALGYGSADIPALVEGAAAQTRLLRQSPRPVSKADLEGLYRSAMRYW
ncbi:MAG: iron-containing alcohol dehydrogenase [Gammaproteobacteria bacterium]|nr:iron-containing alcohol dehydrogenase [Gammaproteobacteria bacterium]